jgi:hypothetical protein
MAELTGYGVVASVSIAGSLGYACGMSIIPGIFLWTYKTGKTGALLYYLTAAFCFAAALF